ncbi:antitoxin [Corynebacterium epidermidicanis]|uniref:Antitoxin protein n=1 Tax=Corynebacterium epidermidicanis TaxID=1050174 RepID=A0A0G3GLN0_9CORY|nr:antitoxin [Corynebacterium epidermidicanis]AKK02079.1 antitoxin protein [Corynebacterium epidermidicanis]
MGLLDKAKELAEQNPDKVDQIIEKVGDVIDEKTGGKFSDQVDQAQEMAKDKLH